MCIMVFAVVDDGIKSSPEASSLAISDKVAS